MKATSALYGIVAALAVAACMFLFSAPASAAAGLDGVSLEAGSYEDVLTMNLSQWRIPKVSRYGTINRIVVEFEDTVAGSTLKSLLQGKRGGCVEKFEIQMFQGTAAINLSGGVRQKLNKTNTLLVAYVEAGVDIRINIVGETVRLSFFRIEEVNPQSRPAPVNQIENIKVEKDGPSEYLVIETTKPVTPQVFQAADPDRLIITFPSTYTNPRMDNQVFRYMETATLFRLEVLGLGSMPVPYDQLDKSGEYHFVGLPTPLAFTGYNERVKGFQSSDAVMVLYPKKNVDFHVLRQDGNIIEFAFMKRLEQKNQCDAYKNIPEDPKPYAVIDEHDRVVDFTDLEDSE